MMDQNFNALYPEETVNNQEPRKRALAREVEGSLVPENQGQEVPRTKNEKCEKSEKAPILLKF